MVITQLDIDKMAEKILSGSEEFTWLADTDLIAFRPNEHSCVMFRYWNGIGTIKYGTQETILDIITIEKLKE